jgi:uncharacterized membrane protein YdbT with pleckstrin-like domain
MDVARVIKLKDGERIIRVVRSYWAVHLPGLIVGAALTIVPFFFMFPLFQVGWPGMVGFVFFVAVGLWYGLRALVIWYWNVFIVTDQRVVDVDQRGFFRRSVSEAGYDKIQDASYSVNGVWRSLLDFGTVRLETAGGGSALEITDVQDPKGVHHLVTETIGRHRERHAGGTARDKVAALLETVSELSDVEAKAFLVAIQRAISESADKTHRESVERDRATRQLMGESTADGEVFTRDVVE